MRGHFRNLAGQRFGRLLVLEHFVPNYSPHSRVIAACDCGNTVETRATYLLRGVTRSCGCLMREEVSNRNRDSAKFLRDNLKLRIKWIDAANKSNQHAKKCGVIGHLVGSDIYGYLKDTLECYRCGRVLETDWSLEHIIDLCNGGTNTLDNLTLSHLQCNREAGFNDWQQRRRILEEEV